MCRYKYFKIATTIMIISLVIGIFIDIYAFIYPKKVQKIITNIKKAKT